MKEKLNNIICLLNKEVWVFLTIGCGVFLFVLIFKPFPVDHIEFDDRILLFVGLGVIVFLALFFVRIVYPVMKANPSESENEFVLSSFLSAFMIWLISSLAFSIYIHFAGLITLSGYVLFKAALICLVPPLILSVYDKIAGLKHQNELLKVERKLMQKKVDAYDADALNKTIEFISVNKSENLSLLITEILFIKSSDNYAEVRYLEGDRASKKLVRNTLRNLELQLSPYPEFIRCHRICIVNTHHIEKLNGTCNHHTLTIKGYDKPIPVSRQYYIKMKETLLTA